MAEETRQTVIVNARVDAKNLAKLDQMASEQDRSRSYMIDKAIAEYVERHAEKPKKR